MVCRYEFTLTGDEDGTTHVEIPMNSFVARRRSAAPTYLSVVIRNLEYSAAIAARSNGDMQIEIVHYLQGVEVDRSTLVSVHLDDIRVDEGASSGSITLTGYQQYTYVQASVEIQDVTYKQLKDGEYRYRCASIDPDLDPGDTIVDGSTTFTSDEIQYIVNATSQIMEVKGV